MKNRKTIKAIQSSAVKGWMDKILTQGSGQHILTGIDLSELSKLTMREQKILLKFISAAYSTGCNDTRQWWVEAKKLDEKWAKS